MSIAPNPHFISGVLKTHQRFEGIASRQTDLLNSQVKADFEEIDLLEKEKLEKMTALSSISWGARIWTPISTAVQYVTNAASVVWGSSSLLQQGYHLAHVIVVASGIAGLANRVLQDTGLLHTIISQFSTSQQIQEAMTAQVAMGNLCISIGLGLVGGIWSAHSGLLPLAHSFKWSMIPTTALLGLKLGSGVIKMKVAFIEKQTANATALVQKIQASISHVFQQMKQHCKTAEHILQGSGEINETMQEAIASIHLRS